MATSLRDAGGGHYHATTLFRVDANRKADPSEGKPASPSTITTTTDLWMDKQGNFRLVEGNDQDGGREITRVGGEITVALRYGKTMRRPAQDAENARVLAEAVGGPWSAWEIIRRQVEVDDGSATGRFALRLGGKLADLPAGFAALEGLRGWRDTVEVKSLDGQIGVVGMNTGGKLVTSVACKAAFKATRGDLPIDGEVAVNASVDQVGKVSPVVMPESETLRTRQRTILEERALLGGLGASAMASEPKKNAP